MTKEQAIEICNKIIQQNKEIVKQTRLNKDINAMQLTANCDNESLAIETVLSMLKEKDRQIDLMSEELIGVPIDNNNLDWEHPYRREDFIFLDSKEEVKQYFERKATNNG